ncbi:LysM peptidoglycan-binding domain-containing protein [Luteimonas vadosa]|uniref:LysM peptidoglycan-binding domain-containing protein n=1 Tax=Luteimonas vadosa TaxID=1165507 RepID=A0ABP9DRI7_9GAMM
MSPSRKPPAPLDPGSLSLPAGKHESADFSKVRSGVSGTARPPRDPGFANVRSSTSSTAETVGHRMHTVAKGDTLSHIAQAHYGKASAWPRIFEANRDQLDDPDRIFPGQVLRIPRIEP